jgi:hypothetical protein
MTKQTNPEPLAKRAAALNGLRGFLTTAIAEASKARQDLTSRIAKDDETALAALRATHGIPRTLYTASHAKALLTELSKCDGDAKKENEVLLKSMRRMLRWLESWFADSGSSTVSFQIAEYDAVRNIATEIKTAYAAIERA